MLKFCAVLLASVVMFGIPPARADWDEEVPLGKTLDSTDHGSVGDHFFHVEWTAAPARDGHVRIAGYIYNDYGDDAIDVALQINGWTAAGSASSSWSSPSGATSRRGGARTSTSRYRRARRTRCRSRRSASSRWRTEEGRP